MRLAGEVVLDKGGLEGGYVLYSPYAGEGFVLVDRKGRVVHEWPVGGPVKLARPLPEGRLLFARMREGVYEVDREGNVLWSFRCRQHHDFFREPNGNTLVLCHELAFNAEVYRGTIDKNDVIVEVDREGRVVWEWHADQHAGEMAELTGIKFPRDHEDWAHTNTIEVLPQTPLGERDSRFEAGNILFSCRNLDLIGVIERPSGRVVWAWGPGEVEGQHAPVMLPEGRILLFDNGWRRGRSRVLELDPLTGEIVWEFWLPDHAFAPALSSAYPLPGGRLLVCAGNPGIIMVVSREGEILWEFHNRLEGRREDWRVAVYRALFWPAEQVEPFIK